IRSGSIDFTRSNFESDAPVTFSDDESVVAATDYVQQVRDGLHIWHTSRGGFSFDLVPTDVRRTLVGGEDRSGKISDQKVTHATVIFRQSINGLITIGTGGVVEITLNGNREVCRVRIVLRQLVSITHEETSVDVALLGKRAEQRALDEVQSQPFVNTCRIVKSEFGFFSADESVAQAASELSFRILVEMRTGPFARLVEKVYTARQLSEQ
ncbi:MAG TPA: hypothetical protein VK463_20750, partial [Desulfomonilaceae bacterium]|nr:hypothetical protein [Desulfomonilaceae bacterium]